MIWENALVLPPWSRSKRPLHGKSRFSKERERERDIAWREKKGEKYSLKKNQRAGSWKVMFLW